MKLKIPSHLKRTRGKLSLSAVHLKNPPPSGDILISIPQNKRISYLNKDIRGIILQMKNIIDESNISKSADVKDEETNNQNIDKIEIHDKNIQKPIKETDNLNEKFFISQDISTYYDDDDSFDSLESNLLLAYIDFPDNSHYFNNNYDYFFI